MGNPQVVEQCGEGGGMRGGVAAGDIEVERQEPELSVGVGQGQREWALGGVLGQKP
ncbi:hypothetical protein [Rhodococcus aetherivorans]|uniref:hypothetical protein n=1 Tax=Rhodococcus aetherivorans TaxID=191292 RepID=UPI00163A159E|nr:hypothetical protein [Rhodococcus aetherivorans]MBC2592336.1 hypothetical protein [Rhodococcus aetherivorans]